jgi:RND superfamily putative drug exporter
VRAGARVLVLDRADVVTGLTPRQDLAGALASARAAGVTVVVGSTGVSATDLLPDGTPVLDVGAGFGAPARLRGGELPPPPPPESTHHGDHGDPDPAGTPAGEDPSTADSPTTTTQEVRA